jgi:hypothetical protein
MIFDEKCLFFPIKADYFTFFYYFRVNMVMKYNCGQFLLLKFTFIIIKFFHGKLEVDNFTSEKNICP